MQGTGALNALNRFEANAQSVQIFITQKRKSQVRLDY